MLGKNAKFDEVLNALIAPLKNLLDKKIKGVEAEIADINTALADLEKGTIKELDVVNLISCESGVYLTGKIIYRKSIISQPFTEWMPMKALLIVSKNGYETYFQWIGSAYILAGLSNAEGEFENEFIKYEFSSFATKDYVNKLIEDIESGEEGKDGKSAYQIALDNGFEGTEEEWLESLNGSDGFSPIARVEQADNGANITITDKNGTTNATVLNGKDGVDGKDGLDGQNGKDGANGIDGKDGLDGQDGVSATHSWNGTVLTVTSASGTSSADLKGEKGDKGDTGASGAKGDNGSDGVGIKSVEQTTTSTTDGGDNVITVTKTDGTTSTFTVKNGSKGSAGASGSNGKDGYTPVKGTDYFTEEDKAELVEDVVSSLDGIPDYWLTHLDSRVIDIRKAMETAGRNKSAFLWYTDAHWANGNSKVSPKLLNYLYMNTPMNKVNFGGDIIGDTLLATREEMKYLYEWRKAIKDLPNHHSVFGNHDMFDLDTVEYEDDNYRYAFLLAPEESYDMVMGDGNYYYIDNPCEKTRYLYIAYMTSDHAAMKAQGQFIVDAIKSVAEGWHIVAIAHRWWQYSSSSTPTTGAVSAYDAEILSVFDAYNARGTRSGSNYFYAQDFTDAKAKVEFCIGGHIHVDYDFTSDGGIPVIITTADANQNRVPDSTVDSGTIGTTTEAAVYGIIADYNDAENIKITVVGVGRGTSRVVRNSNVKLESISNITYSGDTTVGMELDITKFSFTANYSNGSSEVVTGATSVNPTTVEVVGDNTVTITYTEGVVTVSGTITIVGTDIPVVNLFDKNDSDIALTGRFNSSNAVVNYAEGQLVTGYIEGKVGDVFTLVSDKANNTNGYTGAMMMYDSNKNPITIMSYKSTANNTVVSSDDYKTVVFNVVSSYPGKDWDASNTAFVRFCVAYTDIDSITITKS